MVAISHLLFDKFSGIVVHGWSVADKALFFPNPTYVVSKNVLEGFPRSMAKLEFPSPNI
jgi:hypothetical protein